MMLVQVLFFAEYRMLTFTVNFWAFTFPVAASTNVIIRWLATIRRPFAAPVSWTAAAIASVFIATLAAATVVHTIRDRTSTQ